MTKRIQTQRKDQTGQRPSNLAPGALGVNTKDRKMWVGTNGTDSTLMSQVLDEFDPTLIYDKGDVCIYNRVIYQATVANGPGGFDLTKWNSLSDVTRAGISEPYPSGILTGGVLVQLDNTRVQVSSGSGIVIDSSTPESISPIFLEWSTSNLTITPDASNEVLVVNFTSNGLLQTTKFSDFTPDMRRSHIVIGHVIYDQNLARVEQAIPFPIVGGQLAVTVMDEYWARGGPYKLQGIQILGNANLSIENKAGTLFSMLVNWSASKNDPSNVAVPAVNPTQFQIVTSTFVKQGTETNTAVDPTIYDVGGAITPVTAGKSTVQYLFLEPDGSRMYMQIGQVQYDTFQDAVNSLSSPQFTIAPQLLNTVLLGALVMQQDVTDLTDTSRSLIVTASSGPSPGVTPEFEFNDQHLLPRDGSRPMTGNLDMGGNSIIKGIVTGDDYSAAPSGNQTQVQSPFSTTTGAIPGTDAGIPQGRLSVNETDGKLYAANASGAAVLVGQLVRTFSTSIAYKTDDLALVSGVLSQANQDTGPGAVNLSHWTPVGAQDPSAVKQGPITQADSTILPAAGSPDAISSLQLQSKATQTGDLLGLYATDGNKRSSVGPDGLPKDAMEQMVLYVAQTAHSFTKVGQPASFDGSNWTLAQSNNDSTLAFGLVREVINANALVIQFGGVLRGLDPTTFSGGTITSGSIYYVSSTVAGQLTSIKPDSPNRSNPVLLTTSTTDGVVLPWRPESVAALEAETVIISVTQTGHGFVAAQVGAPLYFNGVIWTPASAASMGTLHGAVLNEIVNANTIKIQTTGIVPSINQAVNGNSPLVAGTLYYLSTTVGQITSSPNEKYQVPVYMALSASTGIALAEGVRNPTPITYTASAVDSVPLTVKEIAGQTADLMRWERSTGDALVRIAPDASLGITNPNRTGTAGSVGQIHINPVANKSALVVRADVSQTASLIDCLPEPAGGSIMAVWAAGELYSKNEARTAAAVTTGARLQINPKAAEIGAIIKGDTGQSGDLTLWQDDGGNALTQVFSDGRIGTKTTGRTAAADFLGQISINPTASRSGLVVRADTAQSSPLIDALPDVGGSSIAAIWADGAMYTRNPARSGSVTASGARIQVNPAANELGMVIRAATSQSEDLTRWLGSTGGVLARVLNGGTMQIAGDASAGQEGIRLINVGNLAVHSNSIGRFSANFFDSSVVSARPHAANIHGVLVTAHASQSVPGIRYNNSVGNALFLVQENGKTQVAGDPITGNVGSAMLPTGEIAARKTSYGRVGINQWDTAAISIQVLAAGTNGYFITAHPSQTAPLFIAKSSTAATLSQITASGNVQGTGAYTDLSDIRTKENIEDISQSIDVLELIPREFNRIGSKRKEFGFIAQEVEKVVPEAVVPFGEGDLLGVQVEQIVALMLDRMKEMDEEIQELKRKLH